MNLKKSEEFKHEAVQLALTNGLPRTQVAADLGLVRKKWSTSSE